MVLTIQQVARRVGRDPETVRRWIRSGKLRARKIGTQHVVEESDLDTITATDISIHRSRAWRSALERRTARA
jgi:excisionase family DNA binding protein